MPAQGAPGPKLLVSLPPAPMAYNFAERTLRLTHREDRARGVSSAFA
jgi:hypothetical protein